MRGRVDSLPVGGDGVVSKCAKGKRANDTPEIDDDDDEEERPPGPRGATGESHVAIVRTHAAVRVST